MRHVDPDERRGRFYLWVCRFSTTTLGMWLSEHIAWKLDPYLLKLTGGRIGSGGPVASALLETRGAKTGLPRRNATPFRAEAVEDEAERERLWELADRVFPPFADYREWTARAGRMIPIVRLTPR